METNLEELARLINEKWPDEKCRWRDRPDGGYLHLAGRMISLDFTESDDIDNGQFIIWGLERLEELKGTVYIWGCKDDWTVGDSIYNHDFFTPLGEGKTKAQAVANALSAVLGGE